MSDVLGRLSTSLAGRYLLKRELGRGATATVYLAHELKHDRPVALKVLQPEVAATLGTQRFLREIRLTARLDHPHILPVFDSGEAGGLLWYSMPYVEGESLRERLQREVQLPVEEAVRLARETADALDCAHQQGIVHRDIKPENILLARGHARVADFGLASALEAAGGPRFTESGLAVGTPAYMSPEQASGGASDSRSDVYALGCVLYEMLAGEPPFAGPNTRAVLARQVLDPVPPLRTIRPAVPPEVEEIVRRALAKVPADRYSSAARIAEALAASAAGGRAPRRKLLPLGIGVAAGVTLLVMGGALLHRRTSQPVALDPERVAVAPFDVFDPDLDLWREGIVDILSRNFDGAGPLRSVSPTLVVRRWSGRSDPASASELGRSTGAGLVVFGQLVSTQFDSVRLAASLLDVATSQVIAEVEFRDQSARMDRLTDSATVGLLRELSGARPLGAGRLASLGSRSLPALKSFLQGEQSFRRAAWKSAVASYQRAIALDSTFALALQRASEAIGWHVGGGDSLSRAYARRAGALNHGLAPRDSMLVLADSLGAMLFTTEYTDTTWWPHAKRLFSTLEEAVRRDPGDPYAWYALGDASVHFGPQVGISERRSLDAFARAIALDSTFAPAYPHAFELAVRRKDASLARLYADAYLALNPGGPEAGLIGLAGRFLGHPQGPSPALERWRDTADAWSLLGVGGYLQWWPDSAETGVQLMRLASARQPAGLPLAALHRSGADSIPSQGMRLELANALAFRGHLNEARRTLGVPDSFPAGWFLYAELALLGEIPSDSAAARFRHWLVDYRNSVAEEVPWWLARGDTLSIRQVMALGDSLARAGSNSTLRRLGLWVGHRARAYLALARSDTSLALHQFSLVRDSLCAWCYISLAWDHILRARLLSARGQDQEAALLLELPEKPGPLLGLVALERGRVSERLGRREKAMEAYGFVADVWINADNLLRPYVAEARAALTRLKASRSDLKQPTPVHK